MDNWAHKDTNPYELLKYFTMYDGKEDSGSKHMCKYLEDILENKGYDIVIHDNVYRLEPHIPQTKEKMYDMPIKELMNLHHKLVMKEGVQYIPTALRKTLIRRTKSILINRGYKINYDDKGVPSFTIEEAIAKPNTYQEIMKKLHEQDKSAREKGRAIHEAIFEGMKPVIFDNVKDAVLYNSLTGNNDWVVMNAMTELCKESVNLNKEKELKDIIIRFKDESLIDYVADKLAASLSLKIAKSGFLNYYNENCLVIYANRDRIKKEGFTSTGFVERYGNDMPNSITFKVTDIKEANKIIEEVIKERTKTETIKEKSMKNLLIKFENDLLVKYVATELRNKLNLNQVAPKINIPDGKYTGLIIKKYNPLQDIKGTIAEFNYNVVAIENAPVFVISTAKTADLMIEEVVKEFNKPEYKEFQLGGVTTYHSHVATVRVFKTHMTIDGITVNFPQFMSIYNACNTRIAGLSIGGVDIILLTDPHGNKYYTNLNQLVKIVEAIYETGYNG